MADNRILAAAVGSAGLALAVAGCASSDSSSTESPTATATQAPTSATPTPTTATSSPTATTTSSSNTLPKPPSGSKELQSKNLSGGGKYARYSNASTSPKAVIDSYEKEVKADGYKVTQSGGSGGGWGGYGGSDYGITAEKTGSYFDAQAGGRSGGTTYFEVCVGPDKSAVDKCENESNNDSSSSGS